MADGNICCSKNPSGIIVLLKKEDLSHLYKLKDFLCYSGNIKEYKSNSTYNSGEIYYRIDIYSKYLVNSISKYGVVPNKSITAEVKILENNRDFWRGVVDGDGCIGIYNNYPTINLSGSYLLVNQFRNYMISICPDFMSKIIKFKNKKAYRIVTYGNKAVKIIDNLYKNSKVYLDRKMELAKKATNNFT